MKKFFKVLAAAHVLGAALFFGACSGGGDNPIAYLPPADTTTATGGESATPSGGSATSTGGTATASNDGAIVLNSAASISLDPWSYDVLCKVPDNNNEDWTAELVFDDKDDFSGEKHFFAEFGYLYPTSGKGEGTINLCALDPSDNSTRSGRIVIKYSGGTTVSVPVTQEGSPKNATSEELAGRRRRGIGYGYNAFLGYASSKSIANNSVFRVSKLEKGIEIDEDEVPIQIVYDGKEKGTKYREESGSNIAELEAHLNASVSASAEFGGFSAELESTFKEEIKKNDNYQFAWLDTMVKSYSASISGLTIITLTSPKLLTASAYAAINNTNHAYDNFKDVVEDYGTHVIVGGRLGGKMHVDMAADISKISSSYDVTAMIKAGYKGAYGSANTKVDGDYSKTLKNESNAFSFNSSVLGGASDKQSKINSMITNREDLDSEKVTEWIDSLNDIQNCMFLDFDTEKNLIPIYELVDQTLENGKARYNDFKTYFEGKMKTDFSVKKQTQYVTSAPAKIDIPSSWANDGSLIKDVYIDNNSTRVARIANEFIPQLNAKARVTVVYPATNTKVYYNMGYFVGDASHKPHSVSWNESKPVLMERLSDAKDYGAVSCLYIKSLNMSSQQPDYLEGGKQPFGTSQSEVKLNAGTNGTYKTVKILNHIYLRDYWSGRYRNDGVTQEWPSEAYNIQGREGDDGAGTIDYFHDLNYHDGIAGGGGFCPSNWEVPNETYFSELLASLNNVKETLPEANLAKAFLKGGVLGLNLRPTGYLTIMKGNKLQWHDTNISFLGLRDKDDKDGGGSCSNHNRLVVSSTSGSASVIRQNMELGGDLRALCFPLIFCQPCN